MCAGTIGCGKSGQQYIERGNQLYAAGKYSDATLNYRNALKKDQGSAEGNYRLGLSLLKQNQYAEAYQSFTRAVSQDAKNIPAKVQLGDLALAIYTSDRRHPALLYKQAQTMSDQLLAPGGDRVEGLRLKAALALIDNHPGNAVETLQDALKIAPNNEQVAIGLAQAWMRNNRPDEAERVARTVVEHHPQYAPAYEVLYALYGSQQHWDQAEALMKSWIANNPKQSDPVLRLAAFYYGRKQPDDAEKTLSLLLDGRAQFPQADLLVGDFHALIRNYAKALADYQRGESRDHDRQKVYQERSASMLASLGRRPEAIAAADAILAKDPKNQFALGLKIQMLEQLGGAQNLNTAAKLADDLAKDAQSNTRIQLLAGQAYLMKGDATQAQTYFQSAAKADPRSEAAQIALARVELLKKNYNAVLEHANAALAIRANDPTARLLRVVGLTGTHAYNDAKSEAEQLARDTKDAPQVEMQLAIIALGQGRYAQAEEAFRKLYKEGSENLQPLAGLINTYEAEHQPERALALMQAEAQRSPQSNGKAALLVATAEAAGKDDLALAELQKMAAQSPSSAQVQLRIGGLQQKDGKLAEALQAFQRARQLAPDTKGIDVMIASLEDQLGQKQEAIASYRKALLKAPGDPSLLNNLAFLLAESGGDTSEALQLISTAIRKEPNLGPLQDTLAWIQIKRHDIAEAMPTLISLTGKYPEDATFRYHYAVALIESGDRAAARKEAETALSKKPRTEVALALRNLLTQVK